MIAYPETGPGNGKKNKLLILNTMIATFKTLIFEQPSTPIQQKLDLGKSVISKLDRTSINRKYYFVFNILDCIKRKGVYIQEVLLLLSGQCMALLRQIDFVIFFSYNIKRYSSVFIIRFDTRRHLDVSRLASLLNVSSERWLRVDSHLYHHYY